MKNITLFYIIISVLIILSFTHIAAAQKICVVLSNNRPHYLEAEKGFWQTLETAGYEKSTLTVEYFNAEADDATQIINQIKTNSPDLVFTLGTEATRLVRTELPAIPVVFSMLIRPVKNGIVQSMDNPGGPVTGVTLDIGTTDQIKAMKNLQPDLNKIGVIYNPEENQSFIDQAIEIARGEGLTLIAEKINSDNELSTAFDKLVAEDIDILWLIPDNTVFPVDRNKRGFAIEFLIKNPTLKKIPTYGLSAGFVKNGATLSLAADVAGVGKQAGELAVKILNGSPPTTIGVEYPRQVKLALNLRTAEAIGLQIPADFVKKAAIKFGMD